MLRTNVFRIQTRITIMSKKVTVEITDITNAKEIKKHSDSLGSINEKLIFLKNVLSTIKDNSGDFGKSIKVCEALIRYYEVQKELEEEEQYQERGVTISHE